MESRSIEQIIALWKRENGVIKSGKFNEYRAIPYEGRFRMFCDLAQTFLDEGYTETQVRSGPTQKSVVEACSPPEQARGKGFEKSKNITIDQWKRALDEVLVTGSMSSYEIKDGPKAHFKITIPNRETQKEETFDWASVEIVPKDMIINDTKDLPEIKPDLELYKLLGIEPPKDSS